MKSAFRLKKRKKGFTMIPNFLSKYEEDSHGFHEICEIMSMGLRIGCWRIGVHELCFFLNWTRDTDDLNCYMVVGLLSAGISILFNNGNHNVSLYFTGDGVEIEKDPGSKVVVTPFNIDSLKNLRLPRSYHRIIAENMTGMLKIEELILNFENRIEQILVLFFPLSQALFSLIWEFGICDAFLSFKVLLKFHQTCHELLQDKSLNWIRVLSTCLYKFLQLPQMIYFLQDYKNKDFESILLLTGEIAQLI